MTEEPRCACGSFADAAIHLPASECRSLESGNELECQRPDEHHPFSEENTVTEEPVTYPPRSWAPEVFVDGGWAGNGLRFRTRDEAERSGRELLSRWFVPTDSRATPSTDRPNYRLEGDRNVGLCSECELDATPGTGLCAGHNRLGNYDANAEFAANN